ncbi:MAG: AsmA family protein [Caldimonas sp.]
MTARRRWPTHRLVLAAVAAIVAVAVLSHPWWLASAIGRHLTGTSGRVVHFDTVRIGITASLQPVVHLAHVEIANAPWADSTEPFAKVAEVVAVVSWRSVSERRPVLALVVLRDGNVDLERQADGLRNWRLRDPEDRGPGRIKVLSLQAERLRLRVAHRGIELDLRMSASAAADEKPMAGSGEAMPLHVAFDGEWRGLALAGSVATGPILTFYQTSQTFPLRGTARAGHVELQAEGHAGDIFRAPRLDVEAVLNGSSLAGWERFLGHHYAVAKGFRLTGHGVADERRYAVDGAAGKVGDTDLAGDLAYVHGGERRSVSASLKSESADLDDLLWLLGRNRSDAAEGAAKALAPSTKPFALDRAREFDARLAYSARRLHAARLPALQALTLKAVLDDGTLTVSDLDLGYADGHATGRLVFDAKSAPAAADADLELHGVRVEDLFTSVKSPPRLTGALRAGLHLKSRGTSTADLLANADGTATASLSGGSVSSLLDAEMGLEGGKIVRSLLSGDEALALPCAALALDIRGGTGRIRDFVLDSANTRTTGRGTIDLRERTIDVVLTPTPKRPGLFELERSIRLQGPLAHPRHNLVDRAEPDAAAGAACAGDKR